jgi:hypothetical protein
MMKHEPEATEAASALRNLLDEHDDEERCTETMV